MAVISKIIAFWDMTPYNLVGMYQYFGGIRCLHFQRRIMVPIYKTTRCYIPEYRYLQHFQLCVKYSFLLMLTFDPFFIYSVISLRYIDS
jgi:hypothetical protein